jgi:two-component system, sensor histidine kinase and response regulator
MRPTRTRLLQRQLGRTLGVRDDNELEDLLQRIAQCPGAPDVAQGLRNFLDLVARTYEQHDRDLALRTRSLEISSREMMAFNDRLRHSRDAAEVADAANQAKSTFLANMSHEVRTPLHGVLGVTQLLMGTRLNAEQRGLLTVLDQSAQSLLGVLNDILDHSRIEAGKLEIECIPLEPRELLAEAARAVAVQAANRSLTLFFDCDPDVPRRVLGDPLRLRQVIVNLLSNALKFTDKGEVELHCAAQWQGESLSLRVSVRDTGIGIAPDKQRTVFEAFTQSDASVARRYGGTGLGLTISKNLVERMGGSIRLDSVLGQGTTFSFHVPVEIAEDPSAHHAPQAGPRSVWLLEPRPLVRRGTVRMLTRHGTNVRTLESADLLIRQLRSAAKPPQWLLLHAEALDSVLAAELAQLVDDGTTLTALMVGWSPGLGESMVCAAFPDAPRLRQPFGEDELIGVLGDGTPMAIPAAFDQAAKFSDHEPLRILFADDDPVNRMIGEAMLSRAGCQVVAVSNGEEAVAQWEARPFDAIVLDVQMPVVDGLEAARRIRGAEAAGKPGRHIPIIGATANAMKGDRDACLSAGMDEYIAKPIRGDHLLSTLGRLLAPSSDG